MPKVTQLVKAEGTLAQCRCPHSAGMAATWGGTVCGPREVLLSSEPPGPPEEPRHSGESLRSLKEGGGGEGGDSAGGAGSDSAGPDKDLPAQGEVTPLLCQGRQSHGA